MSETMTLEDLAPLKGDTATPQARVYEKKVDAQGAPTPPASAKTLSPGCG
jgi:hypothetical protein